MNIRRSLFSLLAVAVALTVATSHGATVEYESGSDDIFYTFPTLPGPINGDLGGAATVSAIGPGTVHGSSGTVDVLVDGTGGSNGGDPGQNFFYSNAGSLIGKVLMSWETANPIAAVRTYSWQQYGNDLRYPQVYTLYGSNAESPATDDATLATPTWDELAWVDSRAEFGFADDGSTAIHPRQTAVSVTDGGPVLGVYQHLLWRLEAPSSTAGQHTFMREFDVVREQANVTYEAADPGSPSWFPGRAPVSGDLAENATVTLVEGSVHSVSGPIDNLTDGPGGNGGLTESFFTNSRAKILFSWDSLQHIADVTSFSWQDYDVNDRRFPQIFDLYGSTLESPGTDDLSLASSDWALLASVDSTTIYPYDGNDPQQNPSPEQLAVHIAGNTGFGLGMFRHLLIHTDLAADPPGSGLAGLAPFLSEIDIQAVPEPSSWLLFVVAGMVLACRRRR